MSMDKCRLHILAHSLRHNSQFFGSFQPVASVRTRFHCFLFLAPTFCTPFSSSTGMRIPCRSGFFLSCHQSGWDSSTTIFPSVSLTKSQSLTSLLPHEWSGLNGRMVTSKCTCGFPSPLSTLRFGRRRTDVHRTSCDVYAPVGTHSLIYESLLNIFGCIINLFLSAPFFR